MERNHFKERTEVRMTALGLSQKKVAEMVGVPQTRVAEAMRGDTTPAASSLRVRIDQALNRMANDKREWMTEAVRSCLGSGKDERISLILPEDMVYVVTYGGVPVGTWNPISKVYRAFEEA